MKLYISDLLPSNERHDTIQYISRAFTYLDFDYIQAYKIRIGKAILLIASSILVRRLVPLALPNSIQPVLSTGVPAIENNLVIFPKSEESLAGPNPEDIVLIMTLGMEFWNRSPVEATVSLLGAWTMTRGRHLGDTKSEFTAFRLDEKPCRYADVKLRWVNVVDLLFELRQLRRGLSVFGCKSGQQFCERGQFERISSLLLRIAHVVQTL